MRDSAVGSVGDERGVRGGDEPRGVDGVPDDARVEPEGVPRELLRGLRDREHGVEPGESLALERAEQPCSRGDQPGLRVDVERPDDGGPTVAPGRRIDHAPGEEGAVRHLDVQHVEVEPFHELARLAPRHGPRRAEPVAVEPHVHGLSHDVQVLEIGALARRRQVVHRVPPCGEPRAERQHVLLDAVGPVERVVDQQPDGQRRGALAVRATRVGVVAGPAGGDVVVGAGAGRGAHRLHPTNAGGDAGPPSGRVPGRRATAVGRGFGKRPDDLAEWSVGWPPVHGRATPRAPTRGKTTKENREG